MNYMYVLEHSCYYKETPQYKVVGCFASIELAEEYLRSRRSLNYKNELVVSRSFQNAKFKNGKFSLYDDGVVTSYRISPVSVYNDVQDFPGNSTYTICGNIKKVYTYKNGKTEVEISEYQRK